MAKQKENTEGEKPKVGRPSEYDPNIAEQILEIIATSTRSIKSICSEESMPAVSTVLRWLKDVEEFRIQYTYAKECQADFMAEEMIDIADDGSNDLMTVVKGNTAYEMENKEVTNRSKLRVETRKWIASKLKPKKYGDKLELEATVKNEVDLSKLSEDDLLTLKEIQSKLDPDKG